MINTDIKSRDEIGVLSSSFMEMENEIIDYTKKIELATIEKERAMIMKTAYNVKAIVAKFSADTVLSLYPVNTISVITSMYMQYANISIFDIPQKIVATSTLIFDDSTLCPSGVCFAM